MFIPSTFKRPVSSWKALNLRKTLLMASSVRLKPLNCSRLPCVYAQETLTFLLTQKKTCVKNYVQKNQAVATSQEAVQNQNEPQLRDENAHNDKSVHGVLNPTYQAGLRRDAVQPDIEAERKKRDEIEAGKSYCSRRFGGATCDDKSAQIYARFDKNDWRIQPAEFYRFHDAEVNTFGYF